MKFVNVFVTPILLVSMVQSALGIYCFNCSSYEDPACATLSKNDTASPYYINCSKPEHTFCRKTIITIVDSDRYVRISRSCGFITFKEPQDNCYETDDEFKFERSCQCFQDGCNASAVFEYSLLVLVGALVVNWLNH